MNWLNPGRFAIAVFTTILVLPGVTAAQMITLTTLDGSMTLVGDLRSYENGVIVIETSVGEVAIPANLVDCKGEGCPELRPGDDIVAISGARDLANRLMPALALGLADVLDADVEQSPMENGVGASLRLLDFDGTPLAVAEIASPGTAGGFEALLSSSAAIGLAARAINDGEARDFAKAGIDNMRAPGREHVVALGGLAIVAAENNPIVDLSLPEIAGIFSAKISNWSEVGGPDALIAVHVRDDGSDDSEAFRSLVLAPNGAKLAPGAISHSNDAALEAAVAKDPAAIGVVNIFSLRAARAIGLRSACGPIAAPDAFSLKSEEYPLSRRLYLYVNGQPISSWAHDIVDFALSREAQSIIADAGFVNQDVSVQPKDQMVSRLTLATSDPFAEFDIEQLRAFVTQAQNARRLSTTLRFQTIGELLDAKAMKDIPRLIDYLATQDLEGKEVLLIGYTGPAGRASSNRTLSLARAKLALDRIREMTPPGVLKSVEMRTLGLGEIAPAVCNAKASGDPANDRVEIWVAEKG